jgi:hypothetical protein
MCGMIAARNHFRARTRIPRRKRGRMRQWLYATPRAGTFARAGKRLVIPKGSDDGSLTTPRQVHGEDEAS